MIKATLTRTSVGREYLLDVDKGCSSITISMGARRPGTKRIKEACKPALGEEVVIVDKTR